MLINLRIFSVFLLLALGLGLMGCSKGKSPDATAFENAPPEIKDAWAKAVAADKANDYVTAVRAYKQVLTHGAELSEAQYTMAQQASGSFNQRLVNASNNHDDAAKQALETLNKNLKQ